MASAVSIGLTGLRVSQRALDVTGQNISNAQTPGYHRQVGNLAVRALSGTGAGEGVEMTDVSRQRSAFVETALLTNTTDTGGLTAQTQYSRHLESLIAPGEGSVHDQLESVFNNLQQLASDPGNLAQRRVVLNTAVGLTNQFNGAASDLAQFSDDLDKEAGQIVADTNSLTKQIAELNLQIQRGTIQGVEVNDIADRRDQLITKLAENVDVRTVPQDFGAVNVIAAGLPVVVGNQSTPIAYSVDTAGQGVITPAASPTTVLQVTGGKLDGILQFRNEVIPDFRGRLDSLANTLAQQMDHIQATGVPLSGPLTSSSGSRPVSTLTAPLASAGLVYAPQAGTLSVSVTAPNGARTLTRLNIDPATQSLQDVATALNGVNGLQAVADPQTNTLNITSNAGFGFDFGGRLSTVPDNTAGYTGTSAVQVGGNFTGPANDAYTYRVVGAGGTVGVTPGLTVEVVQQSSNAVIGTLNLGPPYQAGAATTAVNGVQLKFGAGNLNAGDNFQVNVTAEPDTAHVLTALGVNTFFTGSGATTLKVRPDLLTAPQKLATSRSGQPGDSSNLERLVALRDAPLLGANETFQEFSAAMIGDSGARVRDTSDRQTAALALNTRLQGEQQSVSGVDANEELMQMLKFQRAFQMSAKYLDVVNRALDEVMQIVR